MASEFGAKIKISVDTSQSAKSKLRQEIQAAVDKATENSKVKVKVGKLTIPKSVINEAQKDISKSELTVKIGKIDAKPAINNLKKDIEKMLSSLTIGGVGAFLKETSGADSDSAPARDAQQKMADAVEDANVKLVQQKTLIEELKRAQATITSAFNSIAKADPSATDELLAEYRKVNAEIQNIRQNEKLLNQENVDVATNNAMALKRQVEAKKEVTKATKDQLASEKQLATFSDQLTRFQLSNTKAAKEYSTTIADMQKKIAEGKLPVSELEKLQAAFKRITTNTKEAGIAGHTFWETMKKGWEKFGGWSLVTTSMSSAIRAIKQGVENVRILDDAMTELKKVTDLTEASYNKFAKTAAATAKDIGAKMSDTITATADYSRLGYNLEEASALAEASLIYKNVGDGIEDITEASESVISTMKAFKIEAADAMSIVDKFNEVGKILPVDNYIG